jgi:hypothetical protein
VRGEGLERVLGLVAVALQEEQESLFSEELAVVVELVLGDVVVELVQLLAFVLVVQDLSEEEEARALLAVLRLLLLLCVRDAVRDGKKR